MNKYKIHSFCLIGLTLALCVTVAIATYIIDPYFHYHEPNKNFSYTISNERYQNDGILRNFEYDAIITGTSMTENFKTSEFDKLFGVKSVKVSFSGGSYKEINDNIKNAIKYNSNLKYVIRGLDMDQFFHDKDHMRYLHYPEYLTDDDYINDIKYLLNKTTLMRYVNPVIKTYNYDNGSITSFDKAYNWNSIYIFGKDSVLKTYNRKEIAKEKQELTEEEINTFQENIYVNIIETIRDNPNIEFYYFITPYSICYWDKLNREKTLSNSIYVERMIIELMLEYENAHLFSFNDDFDIITDLRNYKDIQHYSEDINSYILECMANNSHCLTKDNYEEYLDKIYNYYNNYNYDEIFE